MARKVVLERSKDLLLIAGHSRDGIREMDLVALWEHLRRILTFEHSNKDTVMQAGAMRVLEDLCTHACILSISID